MVTSWCPAGRDARASVTVLPSSSSPPPCHGPSHNERLRSKPRPNADPGDVACASSEGRCGTEHFLKGVNKLDPKTGSGQVSVFLNLGFPRVSIKALDLNCDWAYRDSATWENFSSGVP